MGYAHKFVCWEMLRGMIERETTKLSKPVPFPFYSIFKIYFDENLSLSILSIYSEFTFLLKIKYRIFSTGSDDKNKAKKTLQR